MNIRRIVFDTKNLSRLFAMWFLLAGAVCLCNMVTTNNTYAAGQASTVWIPNGTYNFASRGNAYLRENGTNIIIDISSKSTSFRLTRDSRGYYTIISTSTGRALDVNGASTRSGANVQTWPQNDSCAQKWAIDYADGYYTFRNACGNNALDITGAQVSRFGTNVQAYTVNGTAAQKWVLRREDDHRIENGTYKVLVDASTRSLDVTGGMKFSGTNVQIWSENSSGAQYFKFIRDVDGSYRILNPQANKSLDVNGASTKAGANVQIWANNNTCAQKWFAEWAGGRYYFRNLCSGNALDVANGDVRAIGTNVWAWPYNRTIAQRWYIER